jgi:hypothetical protein
MLPSFALRCEVSRLTEERMTDDENYERMTDDENYEQQDEDD